MAQTATRYPRGPNFIVNVTQEVMDVSRTRDSSHCMIATAVKDAVPKAASISVDIQTIRFSLPEKRLRYTYLTPRQAQLALIAFDRGEMPEPFSFRLQGAHVTTMYRRRRDATPHGALTPAKEASLIKARKYSPQHQAHRDVADHPELLKQTTRRVSNGAPQKVGGRPPPTFSFARRRQFGLRALVR